jgi:putative ABC transport system permease protein
MITNYLKTALRNLWQNKGFSAINIAGLTLGMTCGLLILLWVKDEKSVDAFHANGDRIYTVYIRGISAQRVTAGRSTPGLLADEMKKQLPQVEAACEVNFTQKSTFSAGKQILKEDANFAGADFFSLFSYPLLEGDAQHALMGPQSMAISRKMAVDFFGSPAAAIGKAIRYENQKDFQVTAVFENLPENVSTRFDCLINWDEFMKQNDWLRQWGNGGPSTYFELRPGTNAAVFEAQVTHFLDRYIQPGPNFRRELGMQRYGDQYLHGDFSNGYPGGGRIGYVRLFSVIALFILLIACVNFMNLTTARSMRRAKEIGVRKVMGAARGLLIRQFVGEAVLMAAFAAMLAVLLLGLVLPAFNSLTGKHITVPYNRIGFWGSLAVLTLFTGLFSGIYPAVFLSGYKPVRAFKGGFIAGRGSLSLRKTLVVFQFSLSIVLILATVLIVRQIQYISAKNLGYDRDHLVYVVMDGDLGAKYDVFKTAALELPGVSGVTGIMQSVTDLENSTQDPDWDGKDPKFIPDWTVLSVGYDFVPTMKMQLVEGRDFSKDFPGDSLGLIINETALAQTGYKDPIGRRVGFWGAKRTIVGVVRDFNFESLHAAIKPIVIIKAQPVDFGAAVLRLRGDQTAQTLKELGKLCRELNPKFPFTYKFADEEYANLYKSEQVTGRLAVLFAVLAIFISCLGLLGLSMFSAERRAREIGIRKVLGAGAVSLFGLLTGDFLVLIGISFAIAVPAGWWVMHEWIKNFAFHTDIPWWLFALAGVLAVGIAMATILVQTIRAVLVNPVVSLRSE